MTLDEIIEDLEFLEDDLERYRYVIELGRELPALPPAERTAATLVRGCSSQAWLQAEAHGTPPRLHFRAEADAQIVRGLVALLLAAYQDRPAAEIIALDVEALLTRLRFTEQLTPGRQNGLFALINRIRALAAEHADGPSR
jgi:cysteine desulfuration protein SufE